jgi:hypothetical protein
MMTKNDGTMSNMEQKYATERVQRLLETAKRATEEKYTVPGKVPSDEELWRLICTGEAKINKKLKLKERYTYLAKGGPKELPSLKEAFGLGKFTTPEKVDQKAIDRVFAKLEASAIKATDEIMLGSGSGAMKALHAFAEECAKLTK